MNAGGFTQVANSMTGRLFLLGLLMAVMLVPMTMVEGTIRERGNYYREAVTSVSEGWAGSQSLADPVLVLPYTYERTARKRNEDNTVEITTTQEAGRHLFYPERTDITGTFSSQTRKRGLFAVPIYDAAVKMTGRFTVQPPPSSDAGKPGLKYGAPFVVLRIMDPRGLHGDYVFNFAGTEYKPEPGAALDGLSGVHIPVTAAIAGGAEKAFDFSFSFNMKGTQDFSYLPHARQSNLAVESNWPHPGFGGKFLPAAHDVRADGFTASWSVGALASGGADNFRSGDRVISVSFVEGIDLYAKITRAVKYGVLFLVLTFGAFFVTEVLRRFRVHPVQYLMVGAALSMFYLLLLALAEHIGFAQAYVVAAAAIAALLGFYIAAVARSRGIGALFGAGIAALYAALYGILGSEDYALLLGTGLLFTVLAAAMVLTRRIDWYALGAPRPPG